MLIAACRPTTTGVTGSLEVSALTTRNVQAMSKRFDFLEESKVQRNYGDGTQVEAVYTSEESARAFMAQRNREYVDNLVGPGTFWVVQKEVQS